MMPFPRAPANKLGDRDAIIVYRDRIAPRSETQFLRRQYVGFERLKPVWVACRTDDGLPDLDVQPLILGRRGALGHWDRVRFKQFGKLPPAPDLTALTPRAVHAQFGRGGALSLPIARALGVPLIVTFHGGDATKDKHYSQGMFPTIFQRRLAALQREAALFVCVSNFVRDRLIERGFPREKLRVIHIGVEIEDSPPQQLEPPSTPPYVLFVGRFVEKKGIAHLIEAARLLDQMGSPIRVVLIGDGAIAGALKDQARQLENVSFEGWLPSHDVRRWMRGALALCVPSVTARAGDADGLPSVVLESMAQGVPVIGTTQSGTAEAVQDGETGLLVPPSASAPLADAIRSLSDQPERRNMMGDAARRAVAERFNAEVQSRLLEDTLSQVIERGAAGATPLQS
jgi:colanic acid/amylovoran biosynthesis glycosyltransferase